MLKCSCLKNKSISLLKNHSHSVYMKKKFFKFLFIVVKIERGLKQLLRASLDHSVRARLNTSVESAGDNPVKKLKPSELKAYSNKQSIFHFIFLFNYIFTTPMHWHTRRKQMFRDFLFTYFHYRHKYT